MILEMDKLTLNKSGAKAYNIKKLYSMSVSTPKSWIIPYDIISNELTRYGIQNTDEGFSINSIKEILSFFDQIPLSFYKHLWQEVNALMINNRDIKRYAIRSSGVLEDGSKNSFAGMYKSYLNQRKVSNIVNAILKCWKSSFSDSVRIYSKINGKASIQPCSILVQGMIPSKCGGVLIKNKDKCYISANYGLAASVVDGTFASDFHVIDTGDTNEIKRHIAVKKEALITSPFKENPLKGECFTAPYLPTKEPVIAKEYNNYDNVITVILPEDIKNKPCLTKNEIEKLLEISSKSAFFVALSDYDIEWCITPNNEIFILQIRPLTRPIDNVHYQERWEGGFIGLVEGEVKGRTYLVENEKDALVFPDSAILVTKKLEGFALHALHKAAGCIVQSETILSHSAILARELRLPTIGVPDIYKIPINKNVLLNGTIGYINILNAGEKYAEFL